MAVIKDLKKSQNGGIVLGAISHKRIIYLIVLALVALGIAGLVQMNRDEFPTFNIKQGLVAAVYPGATAQQVQNQLTEPLEKVLFSFSEVDRKSLKSYSKDGICYIYVDLTTPAKTKDEVWSKIKLRLEAAKLTLPPEVAAIVVLDDFSETSSLLIAMESADKGPGEMRDYANSLCDRLRQIPQLAKASIIGEQQEEIAVNLDAERLASYGINPLTLMLDYRSSTVNISGGSFNTYYANSPIHVNNTVTSEQEIEDRIIFTSPDGYSLRLKDVASVERRYKESQPSVSFNGNTAIIVNVSMRDNNNVVAFGKDVDKILNEFSEELPDSVKMSRITDQPKVVKSSIMGFLRDLLISMVVVIAVMLLLFPIRSALIASSGVPVCTAITVAVMYITGMQLNTVTLGALIVVLGMIVDDSIITMDGYMDKLGKLSDKTQAAVSSAKELFMPMFMATFAISAMFFPTKALITGYLGDFIRSFPWIIAIALGCSLAYAMLVVPSLEVKFISSASPKQNAITKLQGRFFAGMQAIYDKCELFCFNHSAFTVNLGIGAIALGILMFMQLNIQMLPKANRDCFAIEMALDHNSSIYDTKQVSDSLTKILLSDPKIKSVTAFVGESAPRFHSTYAPSLPGDNIAQLIVNTTSNKATVEYLTENEDKYEHLFPNTLIHFKQLDYQGDGSIDIRFHGAPLEELHPYAIKLRDFMYSLDDLLKWVHSDCDDLTPDIEININQDEASRLGVNRATMSLAMAGSFNGYPVATLYEGSKKIPVNIYNNAVKDDMDYTDIGSMLVPSLTPGVSVPVSQLATISPQWNMPQRPRYSGQEGISVYADMKMGESQPEAMRLIKKYIEENIQDELPKGASISYGGLSATNGMVFPQIAWSFLAAVAILFIFLMFHFKKMSIAALTLVLSLLCLFGASLGLWLFKMDFTITAVLGLISLVGIIVRNGIIMFEYAEELRFEKGLSVREAAMLSGQRRMRPIFLTSCTTALGVLPMILSMDPLWMPMGLVIAFGTMLSIFLIVLIMPVSYWILFKNADIKTE